jgi:hemophore-related protein
MTESAVECVAMSAPKRTCAQTVSHHVCSPAHHRNLQHRADPAANPPNCSAADLEGVRSGVSSSTSAYLFTHPEVNYFFTSLEGLPRNQVAAKVKAYMASHPDVKADLTGIRQPLVDLRDRCGAPPSP